MIEKDKIEAIIEKLKSDGAMDQEIEGEPEWVKGYRKGLYEAVSELEALIEEQEV